MLVHKKKRVLVLKPRCPEHITATIPTAKAFQYKGATLVAVPHKLDEVRVLRNMGIKAPSPILHYYDWPRNEHAIKQPFFAQTETAAFFTYHPRAYCHNGLGCIAGDDVVSASRCGKTFRVSMRDLFRRFHNPKARTLRDQPWKCRSLLDDRFGLNEIEDVLFKGEKPTLRITLADGKTFRCTPDHRVMIPGGWSEAGDLRVGDTLVTNGNVEVACVSCGATRQVKDSSAYSAKKARCGACRYAEQAKRMSGKNNPAWKGGRYIDSDGYVMVYMPEHHRARQSGHVCEHILVAEQTVGHPVTSEYHVHHINGVKGDNRPENLEVLLAADHHREHDPYSNLDGGRTRNGGVVVVTPKHGKIVSIEDGGVVDVYDICMKAPHHNFVVNGVVVHNSGKTLSSLWSYDYLRSIGERKRVLVVSTLSTLDRAWGDTIFEHFPHLTFSVLHGSKEKRLKLLNQLVDIYIINHDGLKVIGDAFADRPDIDMVIVDEVSEAARNSQTDRWKSLNEVVNKQPARMKLPPRYCIGLTATPIPNDPTDAWAQCRLITPDTVPPYFNRFKDMVMRQSGPYNWVPREGAMEIVHKVMQPAIRFSREECVDLPPTTYMTREVPLTPEQEKAYKSMQAKLKAEVDAGEVLAVNQVSKLTKLAQIACGVVLDVNGDEVFINCKPRLDETLSIVRESQSKTIVFVPFIAALEAVAKYLQTKGMKVGVVYGDVDKKTRDVVFSGFQKGNEYDVIVAQPQAMAHGLTLTAASTIVWYAPITRADIYEQAGGRVTRPGQKHNTLIVHIEGTPLERKMYNRLQHKQSMQGLLLDMVQGSRDKLVV